MMDLQQAIKAVRASDKIGRGTCSTYDECYDDEELADHIENIGIPYDEVVAFLEEQNKCYWENLPCYDEDGEPFTRTMEEWGEPA
jgi:hypothetical protein